MDLTQDDMQALDDLEQMSSGGSADLYGDISYDGSQVKGFVDGWHPVECTNIELGVSRKNERYVKVTQRSIAGNSEGLELVDLLMLEGKGAARFKIYAKAVDAWDSENDRPNCRYIDLLNRKVWMETKQVDEEWNNQVYTKPKVTFNGYKPINSMEVPESAALDFENAFAEPEVAEPEPEPVKPTAKPTPRPRSGAGSTPPWPTGS